MADRVMGKVALIIGSGIGRATALLFAAEGARVVIAEYSADGCRALPAASIAVSDDLARRR